MPKQILIITAVFPPEPVVSAQLSFDLATTLSRNAGVTVLCPKPSRPLGFDFHNKNINFPFAVEVMKSYTCPGLSLFGRMYESLSFGLKSRKFIRKAHDFDTIYMNAWPLFAQYIVTRTAKKYGLRLVTHVQDIYPESLSQKLPGKLGKLANWLLMPIDKYILRNADQVIAISDSMKEILSATRGVNKDKITVVNNWQDETSFAGFNNEEVKEDAGKFVFMYLGNIGPVAGVELLIDSFAKAKIPNSQLILAGAGSRKEACTNLASTHTGSDIIFLDVPAGKVPEIQSMANVLLLPIKKGAANTSIPSKLPAYMFSRKPIIASLEADSPISQAIHQADCGWVVDPDEKSQLVKAMKHAAAESKDNLIKKGKNGFDYALKYLSRSVNLNKLVSIVNREGAGLANKVLSH